MRFEREKWTPLTVTIETKEEAEVLHKILALVIDDTEDRTLGLLFVKLGEGLESDANFKATGSIKVASLA